MLKVSTPDGTLTRLVEASQRQEYLNKGWIIEDTSEVEMTIDEDGNTLWRYKEDTEWNTISGDAKIKVDGTDTADYLENKLQQGTDITITKSDGKLVINSKNNSYTDAEKQKVMATITVGEAVEAAETITASSALFHITGTTAISTITIPYTGFVGQITIIPDGAFTFTTDGNIAEAYTAVVNRAIVLTYDGTSWYRVNS